MEEDAKKTPLDLMQETKDRLHRQLRERKISYQMFVKKVHRDAKRQAKTCRSCVGLRAEQTKPRVITLYKVDEGQYEENDAQYIIWATKLEREADQFKSLL
jgi:hypothetical protein